MWVANVLLTLPLTFRAVFDALSFDEKWNDFWTGKNGANYYRLASYNMVIFFFATYVPMLMQIASLIFGFVRHKQVKLFRNSVKDGDQSEGTYNEQNAKKKRRRYQEDN